MKTIASIPICRSVSPYKRAAGPVIGAYPIHSIRLVRLTNMNTASTIQRYPDGRNFLSAVEHSNPRFGDSRLGSDAITARRMFDGDKFHPDCPARPAAGDERAEGSAGRLAGRKPSRR